LLAPQPNQRMATLLVLRSPSASPTLQRCGIQCAGNDDCLTLMYSSSSGKCEAVTSMKTALAEAAKGTNVMLLKGRMLHFGRAVHDFCLRCGQRSRSRINRSYLRPLRSTVLTTYLSLVECTFNIVNRANFQPIISTSYFSQPLIHRDIHTHTQHTQTTRTHKQHTHKQHAHVRDIAYNCPYSHT